jgi:hypothetical protein
MTERDPIVTAKAVSSLDRVSGGRFLFCVGAGWNREELANHGDSVDELERRVATLRRRAADAGRVDDWVRLGDGRARDGQARQRRLASLEAAGHRCRTRIVGQAGSGREPCVESP